MKQEHFDCDPTLTDSEVLAFCRDGYMMLEAVVPDEINKRTMDYCNEHASGEPSSILAQDWFYENVIVNPVAAGAVRSLLGRDFHLPVLMSNHRRLDADTQPDTWHVDGNSQFTPDLKHLQVFYYPQEVTAAMGPTEILPGSHFYRNQQRFMTSLNRIKGAVKTAAPAGSIFITVYRIWHRKGYAQQAGVRNLLKYFYWRTTPPARDWVQEEDFDFGTADYDGGMNQHFTEQFFSCREAARLFYWLCGMEERFQVLGGQSWPLSANRVGEAYGFPGPHAPGD